MKVCAARGDLKLQPRKCRVLIPTTDENMVEFIRAEADERGLEVHLGAMKLHGGCVGSDEGKMRIALQEAVSSFDAALKAVSDERMRSQVAWHIIRQCVVNGVGFYARITQPHILFNTIAFIAAFPAEILVYQKLINKYEHKPTPSHPINSCKKLFEVININIKKVNNDK